MTQAIRHPSRVPDISVKMAHRSSAPLFTGNGCEITTVIMGNYDESKFELAKFDDKTYRLMNRLRNHKLEQYSLAISKRVYLLCAISD